MIDLKGEIKDAVESFLESCKEVWDKGDKPSRNMMSEEGYCSIKYMNGKGSWVTQEGTDKCPGIPDIASIVKLLETVPNGRYKIAWYPLGGATQSKGINPVLSRTFNWYNDIDTMSGEDLEKAVKDTGNGRAANSDASVALLFARIWDANSRQTGLMMENIVKANRDTLEQERVNNEKMFDRLFKMTDKLVDMAETMMQRADKMALENHRVRMDLMNAEAKLSVEKKHVALDKVDLERSANEEEEEKEPGLIDMFMELLTKGETSPVAAMLIEKIVTFLDKGSPQAPAASAAAAAIRNAGTPDQKKLSSLLRLASAELNLSEADQDKLATILVNSFKQSE